MSASLLSVEEALEQILPHVGLPQIEQVALDASLERIVTQDIKSDIDLPPFANSSMDGYAVRAADVASASAAQPVILPVGADIPAGTAPEPLAPGSAARIMTGAPMPPGADAVVPVEATDTDWAIAETMLPEQVGITEAVRVGVYVRPAGEDVQRGETILSAGSRLRPQDIGLLAALGHATVPVARQPRAAIISTGDELVGVDEPLTPGKIRDVNSYTLSALITQYGGIAQRLPIARDTLDEVRATFRAALAGEPDLIISSAGVSVGTFDVVRAVLVELGQVNFWRVNVRPGKPLAFGVLEGVPFFGLPGNPVSAMVTFDIFVRPALLKLLGAADDAQRTSAVTGEPIESDGRRSYIRVKLERQAGQLIARTTGTQSSGALSSMVRADGLLIIPEGITSVAAGTTLEVRLLDR